MAHQHHHGLGYTSDSPLISMENVQIQGPMPGRMTRSAAARMANMSTPSMSTPNPSTPLQGAIQNALLPPEMSSSPSSFGYSPNSVLSHPQPEHSVSPSLAFQDLGQLAASTTGMPSFALPGNGANLVPAQQTSMPVQTYNLPYHVVKHEDDTPGLATIHESDALIVDPALVASCRIPKPPADQVRRAEDWVPYILSLTQEEIQQLSRTELEPLYITELMSEEEHANTVRVDAILTAEKNRRRRARNNASAAKTRKRKIEELEAAKEDYRKVKADIKAVESERELLKYERTHLEADNLALRNELARMQAEASQHEAEKRQWEAERAQLLAQAQAPSLPMHTGHFDETLYPHSSAEFAFDPSTIGGYPSPQASEHHNPMTPR